MMNNEDKPLTRFDCDRCPMHQEVSGLKAWVSKIDNRFWAILILMVVNLAATVIKMGVGK
jgi:hypothetical protein